MSEEAKTKLFKELTELVRTVRELIELFKPTLEIAAANELAQEQQRAANRQQP